MKSKHVLIPMLFFALLFVGWKTIDQEWLSENKKGYTLKYTSNDKKNIKEYRKLVEKGMTSVQFFFNSTFNKKFTVFIHPNRTSLESAWQKDWNMPDFKSECWMVASGVATKLDVISPKQWDKEACEHVYSETQKTQQLITHELVHVYHGQLNVSPDFSDVQGMDWFVEGLATYASGQCDSARIAEVKKAIFDNKIPKSLDEFWSGKLKYGLSGSVVLFIDAKYGRAKLIQLLALNKKTELLSVLNTTESELLEEWKLYMENYNSGQ
ncbi:hypothetical protein FLJC2902T_05210 [Flavobacterium limnosediminis JC2902]|uniref:Peptidase MA-like domain-containing protein n=1 Tax=Flavobacterium limnosediminis JC2902 TaxID=1341181 RepID=V6T036_9FLAO|nr:hypothetical protein [Flavobacterium limnosediminis]ESU30030.1 hypothetical protein FLJC2902T_05210 [Flavobacterium limnosediminis JC2902]